MIITKIGYQNEKGKTGNNEEEKHLLHLIKKYIHTK